MTTIFSWLLVVMGIAIVSPLYAYDRSDADAARPEVQLVVTVDWEGRDLSPANLQAMAYLRQEFPEVPLLHYLNAAYFTKHGADQSMVARQIRSVLLPIDEQGLHLHGWKTLFDAANVPHRLGPTFWDGSMLNPAACFTDCGHEVAISAYSQYELERVLQYSIDTLAAHGFARPRSFRAGGWMASPTVIDALVSRGFSSDSSEVAAEFLAPRLYDTMLYQWVKDLWPYTTPEATPHELRPGFWEIPDNGALADYVDTQQMVNTLERHTAAAARGESQRVVVIGFHQETAATYIQRIRAVLSYVRHYNQARPAVRIVYPQLPLLRR